MARIVFDLDGTLIDSAPDIQAVANATLSGIDKAPLSLAETRSFIGNGAPTFVRRMIAARAVDEALFDTLLDEFKTRYVDAVDLTVVFDGVREALDALRGAGHSLGICTNKPIAPTHSVLAHLKMDGLFDAVIGGDSLPVHKPDAAPLHAALEALNSDAAPIYVGDSEVDAQTAVNAAVPFVFYTGGYHKTPLDSIPKQASFDHHTAMVGAIQSLL